MKDCAGTAAGLFSSTIHNFAATQFEGFGVAVFGDSLLTVNDNDISDYTRDGISINRYGGAGSDPNVTISGNTITGNATALNGLNIQDVTAGAVTGNTITGNTRSNDWAGGGIVVWTSTGLAITDNHVNGNFYGIDLLDGTSGVTVSGNELTGNIKRGITLDNSDGNTVSGNIITGSLAGTDDVAIGIVNGATGNMIGGATAADGNIITLAAAGTGNLYAIHIQNDVGAGSNTIRYNDIQGGKRAVQVDGGNSGTTTISDNDITAPSFGGVIANGGNLVVTNNVLTNAVRPVEFWGVGDITVTGNSIYGAAFDAINVGSVSSNAANTVSNNIISGFGKGVTSAPTGGIRVQAGNSNLTINGNVIDHVLYSGIATVGGTNFTITDNTVSYVGSFAGAGFGVGIVLDAPRGQGGQYSAPGTSWSTVSGNQVSYTDEALDPTYAAHNQLTGNYLHDLKNTGIWMQDATYNVVSGNTVRNVTDGLGNGMGIVVYGTDLVGGVLANGGSDNNTITANTVTGADYGMAALDLSDNNTFTGNFITGNATAVGVWTWTTGCDPTGVVFHDNDLSGNTNYFNASDAVDASRNWFGAGVTGANVAAASTGIAYVDITPMLESGDANTGTAGFQANYSALNVTAIGAQTGSTGRIQEALNLVAGSTINVEGGVYNETILFGTTYNKAGVRIIGDAANRPEVTGGVRFINTQAIDGIALDYGATGSITGNTVSNHFGNSQWWSTGILVHQSEHVTVSGNTLSGNQSGIYISRASNNTVSGNILTNNGQAGVMVSNNDTADATTGNHILNNTITGGWTGIWSSYCVGNTYTGNQISAATGNAIYFWDTDNNTVSGNIISNIHDGFGSAWGIALDGGDTTGTLGSDGNIISGNTISNTDIAVWVGNSSDNNTVTGNILTGDTTGVQASAYSGYGGSGVGPTGLVVNNNTITGGTTGVYIERGDASLSGNMFDGVTDNLTDLRVGSTAGTVTIGDGNTFAATGLYIDNQSDQSFDLSGYTHTTFGGTNAAALPVNTANLPTFYAIEDKITDAIDQAGLGFVRIQATNVFVTPNSFIAPALNDTGAIQRAVNAASTGDTVNIKAGVYYDNVSIPRSMTITGAGQGSTIVYTAVSNPTGGSMSDSTVFLVDSDNVTIQNLTVDGDSPLNGAGVDASTGIITDYNHAYSYTGFNVLNVTVQNIYLRGIEYANGDSGTGVFDIENNTVTNVQGDPSSSTAIFNYAGYGIIKGNTVSYATDAISTNWSNGTQFLNNTVTHSGSGVHTDNNGGFGGVADLIQGN